MERDERDSVEIEVLNAEVDRLLQLIGLQNSEIKSDLPQAVYTTNIKYRSTGRAPSSKFMVPRLISTTLNIAIVSIGEQMEEEG